MTATAAAAINMLRTENWNRRFTGDTYRLDQRRLSHSETTGNDTSCSLCCASSLLEIAVAFSGYNLVERENPLQMFRISQQPVRQQSTLLPIDSDAIRSSKQDSAGMTKRGPYQNEQPGGDAKENSTGHDALRTWVEAQG